MANANPAVGDALDPELAEAARELASTQPAPPEIDAVEGQDEERAEETENDDAEPIAEDNDADSIGRRSRRDGKKAPKVDLSQYEEFRKYQAERDRELEQERQRRIRLEQEREEATVRAAEQQTAALEARFRESVDPDEQMRLLQQIKAAGGYAYAQQILRWARHVEDRVKAEGLEPRDFEPTKYQGQEGAVQFERDLLTAKNKKLAADLAEAKKATSPEAIAKLVRAEMAKAARDQGWDTHIPSEDATPASSSSYDRDVRLVQTGRMPPEEFLRRWKGK